MPDPGRKNIATGAVLAVLAALIWSGNFIVARDVNKAIPPIGLNFYRWLTASLIMLPFALKKFAGEWKAVRQSWHYLFWISLTGVSLFNTFVYAGAHYTSAINLALIGTTTSPVISIILARIFLKEKIGFRKIAGLLLCVTGVLFLLSKGKWQNLRELEFGSGDLWMLAAAFCFAVYNVMAKKKPAALSSFNFLFTIFSFGTLLLLPFFIMEWNRSPAVHWNSHLVFSVLYLGAGASVICFFIWNIAIRNLGAGRTALFGNLIPVFSSLEAVLLLHEEFSSVHIVSMLLVITGVLLANWRLAGNR